MVQQERAGAKHYTTVGRRAPSHEPASTAENLFGNLTWVHSSMALGTWVPSHTGGESSESTFLSQPNIWENQESHRLLKSVPGSIPVGSYWHKIGSFAGYAWERPARYILFLR